eukprot:4023047-Pyramimonas_sp.AAC.2
MPRNGDPLFHLQHDGAARRPPYDGLTGGDDSAARLAQDYDCVDDVGSDQDEFFGIQSSYGTCLATATPRA